MKWFLIFLLSPFCWGQQPPSDLKARTLFYRENPDSDRPAPASATKHGKDKKTDASKRGTGAGTVPTSESGASEQCLGAGYTSHADRQASFAYQRSLAFIGVCDCEDKLGNLERAGNFCMRAIKYDSSDPLAYFFLAKVYLDRYNKTLDCDDLRGAKANYLKTNEINPNLDVLSNNAKEYVKEIDKRRKALGCQ
jgi:tetratricopeptide (TPR) repeat protein